MVGLVANYPIFPSLSRQPSMDTSKTTEDDTIRDQAESGYIATRPRFTRSRRTWKVNVRNLQAEDVRALDAFSMSTVQRGGKSFLYPNLLANGSFEFPALDADELAFGWIAAGTPVAALATSLTTSGIEDGLQAIGFSPVAGQGIAAYATVSAEVDSAAQIPCTPDEVYLFHGRLNLTLGTLAAGALSANVGAAFMDQHGNALTPVLGTAVTAATNGWTDFWFTFTAPANAASFHVRLFAGLHNSGSTALTLDASASVLWDEVGCALLTPITPYGRMVGSQPLGCPVRFTKLPELSDIGYGNGVKRYGVNFEVTEV